MLSEAVWAIRLSELDEHLYSPVDQGKGLKDGERQ